MPLTRRKLVAQVTAATGLKQIDVAVVVQKIIDHITVTLAGDGKVELRNFGVFEVKKRKARIGRNLQNPAEPVHIPARATVKFKAGKEMEAAVAKLTPKV